MQPVGGAPPSPIGAGYARAAGPCLEVIILKVYARHPGQTHKAIRAFSLAERRSNRITCGGGAQGGVLNDRPIA